VFDERRGSRCPKAAANGQSLNLAPPFVRGFLILHPTRRLSFRTSWAETQSHVRGCAVQNRGMSERVKLERVSRVFLARLLSVYGRDAPEQLCRAADELDDLWHEMDSDEYNERAQS